MTVLGQRIIAAGRESWRRPGTNVAVFGVRRTDGVIVASLVEQRRDATSGCPDRSNAIAVACE